MKTTPRDNFFRMMRGEGAAWLPFDLTATPPVLDLVERKTGTRDLAEAFSLDFGYVDIPWPENPEAWREAFARLGVRLPPNAEVGFAGVTWLKPPAESVGAAYHFREMMHPLSAITDAKQLDALPWPDLADPSLYADLPGQVRRIHAQGRVAACWLECSVFEFAWYLRGMDGLFADLAEGNGIGDRLLDWFTERTILVGSAHARAGTDVIGLGDDVGTQRGMLVSVPFWRKHLKPRLRGAIAAIRAARTPSPLIRYHSDGDVRAILDDLVEIGVDILNPVQPECMPPAEVLPANQRRLAFWGIIGTQTTMPFGTPGDVRAAVADCARWAREGAKIVVAPTHVLEPDVPWANIEALVTAPREVAAR